MALEFTFGAIALTMGSHACLSQVWLVGGRRTMSDA